MDEDPKNEKIVNLTLVQPSLGTCIDALLVAIARELEFIRRDSAAQIRLSKDIQTSAEQVNTLARKIVNEISRNTL